MEKKTIQTFRLIVSARILASTQRLLRMGNPVAPGVMED